MPDTTTSVYAFVKPEPGGSPGTWDDKVNSGLDAIDAELARKRVPFLSPTVGATTTLDLNQNTGARVFVFTVTQGTTIAFSNVPSSSFECEITLIITNGSAFVVTWPASVVWVGGAGPALRASGVDIVRLITRDGGTTWYASKLASNSLIYQNQGLTTTSTSEVSVASFSVPAGMLGANGQALRVTLIGQVTTQNATNLRIRFGATDLCNFSPAAGKQFFITAVLTRTGATAQLGMVSYNDNSSPSAAITGRSAPAETLANAITLDFRGSVTSGGTLFFDSIQVEFLGR